jgi:murein DD-endopeptidase MepM/ murein hydrolase activator NlpD
MTALQRDLLLYQAELQPVVPFDAGRDRLALLDLTAGNTSITEALVADTELFSAHLRADRLGRGCTYLIGGYAEHRTMYGRSSMFDDGAEPRRFHLGLDIWGEAGTPVAAALDGQVHSTAFNDRFADYGATIILEHLWRGHQFYSLYGHLSAADLRFRKGDHIPAGTVFAHFGEPKENGWWPPHLHIQLILDMGGREGDYPGVCRYSERAYYLDNCPDPDLLCRLGRYV